MDVIETQKQFTEENIKIIQSAVSEIIKTLPKNVTDRYSIIMTGSYGRFEASNESDLDTFIIVDSQDDVKALNDIAKNLEESVSKIIPKKPGSTGTFGFGAIVTIDAVLSDIGGVNDNNLSITRRMLMLLEGKALINPDKFESYRRQLLEKYIKDQVDPGQLAKFFLNDIIRYWRTMATDYEFKTYDERKDWGVRNIKLKFSRKLLYVSGIIAAAETVEGSQEDKIKTVIDLLELCPVERIRFIGRKSPASTEILISHYRYFVEEISKPEIRSALNSIVDRKDRNKNPEYVNLRNRGKEFAVDLANWLKEIYPNEHKIHSAMLF
jgi:predicted nucleotidyltransferase